MSSPREPVPDQVSVHHLDMGGWVRFFVDPDVAARPDLAAFLSYAVTEWFRQRRELHLCHLLPVMRGGNTIELHAWYAQDLFAATPVSISAQSGGSDTLAGTAGGGV